MVIKRFSNIVKVGRRNTPPPDDANYEGDTPEANVQRGIRQFCESSSTEPGDEVLHLPVIVDAAESSPGAAAAAAHQIRKYMSKDNFSRPQVQYNAIMLIRILSDNPGASFTKNLDQKFASTMKTLLRESRDQSVQQIARETLSALYVEKAYDTNLNTLFAMWTKEQPGQIRPRQMNAPQYNPQQQQQQQQQMPMGFGASGGAQHDNYARGNRSHAGGLPPPSELAARVEEARTSAKLLQQLVQSTPAAEVQGNDLIREFGQRVSAAQRSVQSYISSDNPPPDEDTLQTLIETSEQLSLAASKHQRAILQSRRLVGNQSPPPAHGNPEQYFPGSNIQGLPAPPPQASTSPELQPPPLPARTGSNGLPLSQPEPRSQPRLQQPLPQSPRDDDLYDSYQPPSGPPPGQAASEVSPQSPHSLYSAPPMPASHLQANLASRTSEAPPVIQPIELGSPTPPPPAQPPRPAPPPASRQEPADDPFSDSHASPDVGQASFGPVPPRHTSTNPELTAQARLAADDDPRSGAPGGSATGSPHSYHPGYSSTPSYVHRQASAGDKLVMHGGAESPEQAPVQTPKRNSVRAAEGNVSPLLERHGERA